MNEMNDNQVVIDGTIAEVSAGTDKTLERPPLPNLLMGKDKKTDKVVITVTRLEKDWIRYLAQEAGYENVTDYMMSFIYELLKDIYDESVIQKSRGKRKKR